MKPGVAIDKRYMDHDMDAHHVESPARIGTLLQMLEDDPPGPIPGDTRPAPPPSKS